MRAKGSPLVVTAFLAALSGVARGDDAPGDLPRAVPMQNAQALGGTPVPRARAFQVGIVDGVTASDRASESRRFARLDLALGLGVGFAPRLTVPMSFGPTKPTLGNVGLGLAATRMFTYAPILLQYVFEVGGLAPGHADGLDFAGFGTFRNKADVNVSFAVTATLPHTGISLTGWGHTHVNIPRRGGFELAYAVPSAAVALRTGFEWVSEGQPRALTFGLRLKPDRVVGLELFGVLPVEGLDSMNGARVLGLSLVWDVESKPPRPEPNSKSDARELPAMTVRGHSLSGLVVPGRFTVFVFGAAWCIPCVAADRELRALVDSVPNVAVRHIDADEATDLFFASGGSSLPYFVVYDPKGRLIGKSEGALGVASVRSMIAARQP